MFLGTIPDNMRKILVKYIPLLGPKVSVICSGNFTSESALRRNGYGGVISSCDVSLYTCSLGRALTERDFRLEVKPPELDFLRPYLDDPVDKAVTVMLMQDGAPFYRQKNDYQRRMWTSYLRQWESLHPKMKDKFLAFKAAVRIDEFHAQDLRQRMWQDPDATVLAFMPTYKGGYESLYKVMGEIFDWDAPEYAIFEQKAEFYEEFLQSVQDKRWLIMSELDLQAIHPPLGHAVSVIEKNRSITCRVYSNLPSPPYFTQRKVGVEPFNYPAIGDHRITADSTVEVLDVESKKMNYLREVYSGAHIKLAFASPVNLLLLVDKKIAGGICLDVGKYGKDDICTVYGLADFALPATHHKRLSKLVVMALVSHEVKAFMDKRFVNRFDALLTTAFTEKPVSMKYRGVLDLLKRGDDFLNYGGPMGQYTLQEAFAQWWQKHGKVSR